MADWPIFVWAFGAAGAIYVLCERGKNHLSTEKLARWLDDKEESQWALHFGVAFDAVMGPRHFSWRRIFASAIASVITIFMLWWLFGPILDLMGTRTDVTLPFGRLLLIGIAINLVADYISLIETRWLLARFEHIRNIVLQIGLLLVDLLISGVIIFAAITLFRLLQGEPTLSMGELVAGYTPYAIFFYSTFFTSIWAWAFCASAWFLRLFTQLGLKKILPIYRAPFEQVGLVAAFLVFVGTVVFTPIAQNILPDNIDAWLCEKIGGKTCTHAGRLTKDEKERIHLLTTACTTGDAAQCRRVIDGMDNYRTATAAPLLRTACREADDMRACNSLGYMYQNTLGIPQDYKKARDLYQRACDGDNMMGCNNLGYMYHSALGIPQDYEKARDLFQRACDGDNMRGCNNLGYMYQRALGIPQDYKKARDLYQRACDGDEMSGCYNLGYMYYSGLGIPQDYEKARDLYQRACDGGNEFACRNLKYLPD